MDSSLRSKIPLFISHLHQDKPLVDLIHRLINDVFSEAFNIFNTSGKPPEAGKKWREEIWSNLDQAQVVLVILTPRSAQRDWVLFESGAAWLDAEKQKKKLIPCLYNMDKFPSPLSEYQGIRLGDPESVRELIDALKIVCNLNPSDRSITEALRNYFVELEDVKFKNSLMFQQQASKEIEKVLQVVTNFFPNSNDAIRFAKVLKAQSIIDEELYGEFLKNFLVKKY